MSYYTKILRLYLNNYKSLALHLLDQYYFLQLRINEFFSDLCYLTMHLSNLVHFNDNKYINFKITKMHF